MESVFNNRNLLKAIFSFYRLQERIYLHNHLQNDFLLGISLTLTTSIRIVLTISGHTNHITAISTQHNGNIISSSYDHTIRIWDASRNYKCTRIINLGELAYALLSMPNGDIISGSESIRLLSYRNEYKCTKKLSEDNPALKSTGLVLLDDDQFACSSFGQLRIYHDMSCFKIIKGNVHSMLLLTDGNLAVADERQIRILDCFDNYKCVETIEAHNNTIYYLIELPNRSLVSCSNDNSIKLWSRGRNGYRCIQKMREDKGVFGYYLMLGNSLTSVACDDDIRLDINRISEWNEVMSDYGYRILKLPNGNIAMSSSTIINICGIK
jgi:WD40 repeat protein